MSHKHAQNDAPDLLLLATILNNMDESIAVFDTEWRYVYINQTAASRAGHHPSELLGQCVWEMFPEAVGTPFYKQYHEAMERQVSIDLEEFYPPRNKWYLISARPLPNALLVYAKDVTQRHEVEERARRHIQEIETLNIRLHRAIQETHHRVKNNLQVIAALVEMQRNEGNSEMDNAHLQRINQHICALATIHDLLTQQAKTETDPSELNVQDVFGKLIPILQQTSGNRPISAEAANVTLSVMQSTALSLLVSECVSNAIKHATGEIAVVLCLKKGQVRLEVCDSGSGFPSDFDPSKMGNTGMELIQSAARWDLRGELQFTNRVQGGGCVVVTFPVSLDTPTCTKPC